MRGIVVGVISVVQCLAAETNDAKRMNYCSPPDVMMAFKGGTD
ncbi:hypothetical protein ACP2AV_15455 [Aliiroseovarius sp. PTFE2010]